MGHDHLLIREHDAKGFDLSVGEPVIVRDRLWRGFGIPGTKRIWEPGDHAYPRHGGEAETLRLLRQRHPLSLIVVTNGAKQAIAAALYAFKQMFEDKHDDTYAPQLCHEKPYWLSYPTLAEHAGMHFGDKLIFQEGFVNVVTTPNNPDGGQSFDGGERYDIWDAAYANELYGWNGVVPKARCTVWSAAKLFGLSGARIGWLTTQDPDIARLAAEYVEISTSGVSTLSQELLCEALLEEKTVSWRLGVGKVREALRLNGEAFLELLSAHCERYHGVPETLTGMFAWFRVRNPAWFARALKKSGVKLVPGEAFGYHNSNIKNTDPEWYRMSMGQTPEYTRRALEALRAAFNE